MSPPILDQALATSYNSEKEIQSTTEDYRIYNKETVESDEDYAIQFRISSKNESFIQSISNRTDSFEYNLLVQKPASVDVKQIYQYEYFEYENLSRQLEHLKLPNYNLFINARPNQKAKIKSYNSKYNISETHSYRLVKDLRDVTINYYYNFFDKANQTLGNEVKDYSDNYYKFFTDTETFETPLENDFYLKTKHVFFDHSPKYNHTDYIPFFNLIKINRPKEEEYGLVDILRDSGLLMKYLIYTKRTQPTVERYSFNNLNTTVKKWNISFDPVFFGAGVEEQDDETFIKQDEELKTIGLFNQETLPLTEYFDNRLKKYILFKKMQKFKKDKTLTFEQMIINKSSIEKEFVGYKIEKMLSLGGSILQTYYILSNDVNLIDSQIQYDRTYFYKISEIYFAYENEYSYTTSDKFFTYNGNGDPAVDVNFISNVQVKIFETSIGVFQTRMLAPPLFKPDVRVYTNTQVDHKVKFLVSDRFGNSTTREDFYTVLNESDKEYRERLKLAGIVNSSNRSYFSYRSRTGTYRVYKLEKKPTKYEDFTDSFLGVIGDTSNLDGTPSALFTDHIKYEQKYYYLFVPISRQGQGGNPSYVQEVQLLKDADENILRYNSYELPEPEEDYINETSYRKFIQIVPNYNQTIPKSDLDMGQLNQTDEDPKLLGPDENSLWDLKGNRFIKLRVESKSTGKKFDLNLRFKLKKS